MLLKISRIWDTNQHSFQLINQILQPSPPSHSHTAPKISHYHDHHGLQTPPTSRRPATNSCLHAHAPTELRSVISQPLKGVLWRSVLPLQYLPSPKSNTWLTRPALGTDVKDYEKHKEDSLSKQKSGKGHWKPELASDGEEAVKADRTPDEDISKLQERTKKHAEEKSKSGTSGTDPM